ncbi:MAG TPA: FtsK/SpoIIIE domain-containing protein, partial [Acidimicrobiales bacterium]|nr:FtsK/SpoIIIE domain-containing protein [Acidimicrobiales bacterium]
AAPGAGATEHPLRYGDSTVGRDLDNDVVVKDHQFSRRHARLTVTDVVTVTDLGSKNGVVVGDTAITTPTVLRPGQTMRVGDVELAVRDHRHALDASAAPNRIDFNRPPRVGRPYGGIDVELPAPPERPRKQRLPWFSALLPVGFGLALVLLVPSFGLLGVAFMLLSPVLLIGSYIEAKRSGAFDFRDALADHGELVTEHVERLERERELEVRSRFHEAPSGGELRALVGTLSDRLWERAPGDSDFLSLRVGTATLPSRTRVKVASGGARDLRRELDEIPGHFRLLDDVPLCVPLEEVGGIGLSGPRPATLAMARSLVLQAATLHSPNDLALVALVGEPGAAAWDFLKWLPHARSLGGSQLASTSHHALALVERLLASRPVTGGPSETPRAPAVLVVIDESCPLERGRLAPLLEAGRGLGLFFLWVAPARHLLPKACGAVIDIGPDHVFARAGFTGSGLVVEPVRWEGLAPEEATAIGRDLTPINDVTGRVDDEREIPGSVGFADLYGGGHVLDDPTAIVELWQQHEHGGLRVIAGMQAGAPLALDIRHDGPHALVAGTTGAGKSEFLQSLIVGLATMHSPERITFLLVDYKGGAAFKECVQLPHTVGMVTDLDRHEVRRALVSLEAELRHRERLLQEADAKDLVEMERKRHPKTPPSLVIVVDEFAALAKEVPEFVDGVVDVALRGRSLGLHLVLATQRPAGVITGPIRANTNLRIALRMAADEESVDVIGSPVAAHIERRRPGRAVARIGPQELVPFQSAYVGGHTVPDVRTARVRVRRFGFDHDTPVGEQDRVVIPPDHPSDLQRLVTTHRAASGLIGVPAPRRPWLPPLAKAYSLGLLPTSGDDASILLGVGDEPVRQRQTLVRFRPDVDGGLVILGTGGSGKTVALRTVAISAGLTAEATGEPVEVHALDFAGRGLDVLEGLPHVGSVIGGDDTERVTRLLRELRERIDRRAIEFAAARAASLPEFRRNRRGEGDTARVLVLLDSYPGFQAVHEKIEAGRWLEVFSRIVADGRQVGIHVVLTADRRSSVPMSIGSAIPRRVVLRLANDDEYLNAGEPVGILSPQSPPGRGLIDGTEVQIAVLGGTVNGQHQADEIARLARRLRANGVAEVRPIGKLPVELRRSTLPMASTAQRLVFAIGDDDLTPRALPLAAGHVIVAGPPRSGRTSALATLAQAGAAAGLALFHVHARATPLSHAPLWAKVGRGPEGAAHLLRTLAAVAPRIGRDVLVVGDDFHELCDTEADDALSELLVVARDHPISIVLGVDNQAGRRQYSGVVPQLRKDGVGLLLQPDIDNDGDLLGVALPRSMKGPWPEGRGYFVVRGRTELVQVALPDAL